MTKEKLDWIKENYGNVELEEKPDMKCDECVFITDCKGVDCFSKNIHFAIKDKPNAKIIRYQGKFLNLVTNGKYESVERANNEPLKADAVTIIATTSDGSVVCIKEKRIAIIDHSQSDGVILSFPAGLIDEGETAEISGARELLEETGYVVDEIQEVTTVSYNSSGLTNESTQIIYCTVTDEQLEQDLQGNEEIEVVLVKNYDEYSELIKTMAVSTKVVQHFTMMKLMGKYDINN